MRFYDEHQDPYTHQNIASRESEDPLDFAPYLEISTRDDITCPAEVIFSESKDKQDALRRFRDGVLAKTAGGRYIIACYYRAAPTVSSLLVLAPSLRTGARKMAEALLPLIRMLS
jgi:cell wall-associated protease